LSRNSLYNVISQEITPKTFRLDGVQTASLNRHQSGSPYFLFELAKEIQPFCIAPYSLESHHVSVYEQATSVLDLKSQYHYTAYFNDGNGSRFRLHVFYNQNDTLVTHPLLAKETADHEYEPISSHEYAEYDEVFSLFAAASTKKLVTHLRNTQNELLRKHDEQYQMMDDNASKLSKNLAENIEQYQTIITEMITKLEQAQNHANETKERGGKIALLKNIYKATKHYKPAPSKNEEVTETDRPKINKKTKTVGSNKPSQSRKSKAKHSKSKVNINQTQAEPVDLGLEALENRFSLWKESQVPEEINALHAALISIELMLSFKTDLVSVEDILRLERLKNEVEKAGERELKKCLYQSDLQKAEILS